MLRDRASLAVSMTGSFVLQALYRPAQCIVEMVEQFSHPCEALQVFAVGTLPKHFACSLAFKPNTDDMREAPSRALMEALWAAGAKVRAYDPVARDEVQRLYGVRPDLDLCDSAEAALAG